MLLSRTILTMKFKTGSLQLLAGAGPLLLRQQGVSAWLPTTSRRRMNAVLQHGSRRSHASAATTLLPLLMKPTQQPIITMEEEGAVILEEDYDANKDRLTSVSAASFDVGAANPNRKVIIRNANNKPKATSSAPVDNNNNNNNNKSPFEVTAKFEPTGDQPEAIRQLLEQLQDHKDRFSVLQGITGTGLVYSFVRYGFRVLERASHQKGVCWIVWYFSFSL